MLTIHEVRNLGTPQKSYKYSVTMPSVGVVSGELISRYVEEVQGLPFPAVEPVGHYEGGTNSYHAGLIDIEAVSISFFQIENDLISRYIESWRALAIDPATGLRGYPVDYKFPITVSMLKGDNSVASAYRLTKCWPSQTAAQSLQYATSERLNFTQTFSVDGWEPL